VSRYTDNIDLHSMTATELRALRKPLEVTRDKADDRLIEIMMVLSAIKEKELKANYEV
jgi:hypothetical protein